MERCPRALRFLLLALCLIARTGAAAELDELMRDLAEAPAQERSAVLAAMAYTGDARVDFTAAGSGNNVVLSGVYTDEDEDESGTFTFRKQNL